MAKKKRRSFPDDGAPEKPKPSPRKSVSERVADSPGGFFSFFKDLGVRETIESILIAILLALLFRAYEAEAFIIPTGSMAPSLQGEHKDLCCEQCNFQYRIGASAERRENNPLIRTTCPLCRFETQITPRTPSHSTNNGDRIVVNKFVYDFQDPKRFDVIVFKNPNIAKQNYIKRLIGLPGENILIARGDIYTMEPNGDQSYTKKIARKPSDKVLHTLSTVADTNYWPSVLRLVEWPLQWEQRRGQKNWKLASAADLVYSADATPEVSWLRFRNNGPRNAADWERVEDLAEGPESLGAVPYPGRLISDAMAYNEGTLKTNNNYTAGLHWVGDVGLEADFTLQSGNGTLLFDLVEGGAHFQASVDTSNGQLTLNVDPPTGTEITFVDDAGKAVDSPTVATNIKGPGSHSVRIINADDQIHLWVDGSLVPFNGMFFTRSKMPMPTFSDDDPGDLEPVGIGCQNLKLSVERLKVVRDTYYISASNTSEMTNESGQAPREVLRMMASPRSWNTPAGEQFFGIRRDLTWPMFTLKKNLNDPAKDQFLPMGDNSTQSLDGRVWDGPKFVERDFLIGRGLFVFWPHTTNEPIPYLPNFARMQFIR